MTISTIHRSYADSIRQYSHAPDPGRYTCTHCGVEFSGKTALQKLRNHLGWCERRVLLRHLKYKQYVFVLSLNPKRKLRSALTEYVKEKDPSEVPQLVIGALLFLKKSGQIRDFTPINITNSPEFSKIPDGITSYKTIFAALSLDDKERFGQFCEKAFADRFGGI